MMLVLLPLFSNIFFNTRGPMHLDSKDKLSEMEWEYVDSSRDEVVLAQFYT
jgi:hypothetical protein